MRRLGKRGGGGLLAIVVTGMTLWGMGALSYSALPALLHSVLAATFGLACPCPPSQQVSNTTSYVQLRKEMMMPPARPSPWPAARGMRTCAPRPRVVRDTMRETSVVILLRSVGYA